jgi:hypothetical protein
MFPYVVIGGEDSDFGVILDKLIINEIDPMKINFCILPFGIRNNIAQITNWGSSSSKIIKKTAFKTMRELAQEVKNATIGYINVWEIEVTCIVIVCSRLG